MSQERYCAGCGRELAAGRHERCRKRLAGSDPPRFCTACGRKLEVQLLPLGFTARCLRCRSSVSAFRS